MRFSFQLYLFARVCLLQDRQMSTTVPSPVAMVEKTMVLAEEEEMVDVLRCHRCGHIVCEQVG